MSRDWTPQQLHAVDRQMDGKLSNQTISFEYNGKSEIIHDPNCEDAKAFPNLYFLGNDVYKKLKKQCSITFIYNVEMVLAEIVNIADNSKNPCECISDIQLEKRVKPEYIPLAKLVRNWFEGKLDPNFYYNEWNNEMFLDNLLEVRNDFRPRCDTCNNLRKINNHDGNGIRCYCGISNKDVTQSYFGKNSPRDCALRKSL